MNSRSEEMFRKRRERNKRTIMRINRNRVPINYEITFFVLVIGMESKSQKTSLNIIL